MNAHTSSIALPRSIAIASGLWLSVSALLWPHTDEVRVNNLVIGAIVTTAAFWAAFLPPLRRINTVAALWLIVSALLVFPHLDPATMWHDALLGFIVLGTSLSAEGALHRRKADRHLGRHERTA